MSGTTGIILFLIIIFGSLFMVSFVNRVQTRSKLMRQKSLQLKRRLDELDELCANIEPLLESVLIPKLINEEVLDLIDSLQRLDPNDEALEIKKQQAIDLANKLSNDQRSQPINRAMPSDAAVARSKYHLNEAAKIVRRHAAIGRLDSAELDMFIQELAWATLMIDVITHIAQGHKAVSRNDPAVAYGYYRKAQNFLVTSNNPDNRRHRIIKELSNILDCKNLFIAPELMPETQFNPTKMPNFSTSNLPNDAPSENATSDKNES